MTASVLRGNPKAIPTPTQDNVLQVLSALVEEFNLREGRTPNPNLRFVTVAELQSAGLVVAGAGAAPASSSGAYVTDVSATEPIESSGGQTPDISLKDGGVTYAKMQQVTSGNRLIGNPHPSPGQPEEIEVGGDVHQEGSNFYLTKVGPILLGDGESDEPGPPGPPGMSGSDGKAGLTVFVEGEQGEVGPPGAPGAKGDPGTAAPLICVEGDPGEDGQPGPPADQALGWILAFAAAHG